MTHSNNQLAKAYTFTSSNMSELMKQNTSSMTLVRLPTKEKCGMFIVTTETTDKSETCTSLVYTDGKFFTVSNIYYKSKDSEYVQVFDKNVTQTISKSIDVVGEHMDKIHHMMQDDLHLTDMSEIIVSAEYITRDFILVLQDLVDDEGVVERKCYRINVNNGFIEHIEPFIEDRDILSITHSDVVDYYYGDDSAWVDYIATCGITTPFADVCDINLGKESYFNFQNRKYADMIILSSEDKDDLDDIIQDNDIFGHTTHFISLRELIGGDIIEYTPTSEYGNAIKGYYAYKDGLLSSSTKSPDVQLLMCSGNEDYYRDDVAPDVCAYHVLLDHIVNSKSTHEFTKFLPYETRVSAVTDGLSFVIYFHNDAVLIDEISKYKHDDGTWKYNHIFTSYTSSNLRDAINGRLDDIPTDYISDIKMLSYSDFINMIVKPKDSANLMN